MAALKSGELPPRFRPKFDTDGDAVDVTGPVGQKRRQTKMETKGNRRKEKQCQGSQNQIHSLERFLQRDLGLCSGPVALSPKFYYGRSIYQSIQVLFRLFRIFTVKRKSRVLVSNIEGLFIAGAPRISARAAANRRKWFLGNEGKNGRTRFIASQIRDEGLLGKDQILDLFQKRKICTLEAGVKIYSLRVDSVLADAYKVLGGINRTGTGDKKSKITSFILKYESELYSLLPIDSFGDASTLSSQTRTQLLDLLKMITATSDESLALLGAFHQWIL
eukprot:Gb_03840 [translate_table: standard]